MKQKLHYNLILFTAVFLLFQACKDAAPTLPNSSAITEARSVRGTPNAGNDAQPPNGDNSNLFLGNPSNAQTAMVFNKNYLIDMKYFTLSYDSDKGVPNWVSWYLDKKSIAANARRQNNFAGYSGLPSNWYMVRHNSYTQSGFDRGHNCPSADRLSSVEANSATFLMVNMIPQAPRNNQGVWGNFESYLRTRVNQGNEVYIIMGSYGTGGTGSNGTAHTIDQGRIAVPSNVYKIAVILPEGGNDLARIERGDVEVIAINTPNVNVLDSNWRNYRVTVRSIENATGHNFFSRLSPRSQTELKNRLNNAA
ncbi:DNA/RNA non-specific endonuclease [Sphingobacterium sp. lm-10]|uniref:DNA/RNA non-specific endonuclease n=1 Tax=Sphingobacterium sp. lm-10 TaxID=2944904 RepID=UPI0020216AB6|nr:DNA/RNA non-specific endonuclease [Sphingobacterium sp. lm-10]MCL7986825.1 DNA/RNA non-specific endonuclease [Sphingobacterium sp. lm-10]